MKLLHLSDSHFHQDNVKNKAVLKALVYIQKTYPNHHLILTGDITDDGIEKQYANVISALRPFRKRIWLCPGNHDYGTLGAAYDPDRAHLFDNYLLKEIEQDGTFVGSNTPIVNRVEDVLLIALDSCLETKEPWDYACGEIGKEQLSMLQTILANPESAKLKKVVFFHHHPFMHSDPFMRLRDAEALWKVMYQKVDVVLFGHKHVKGKWENYGGIKLVLSSGQFGEGKQVREVTIEGEAVSFKEVRCV